MGTLLWILQGLLFAVFMAAGITKLTQPRFKMAAGVMTWAANVTDAQFRAVGMLEVLGAVGVLLPTTLGIVPVLTPLAASGLAVLMVGAVRTHIRHGEIDRIAPPLVLFVVALLVVVLRLGLFGS